MVELKKYKNNVENFECRLIIKNWQEIYEIYTRLPNWNRNKITKSFKTSSPLTNALGTLIVNKPTRIMVLIVGKTSATLTNTLGILIINKLT